MKQLSSWAAAFVTPLFVLLVTIAVFITGAPDAWAYSQYSANKDATNCRACHGDFRSSPYISLSDGGNWGDDLHDVHRNVMLGGDCSTCHSSGPRFPVLLDSSIGGSGLADISCVGCHGRAEDDSVANGGLCTAADCGPGAGLRQHHTNNFILVCTDCHDDANPDNYTPVGEDVDPPYYFTPDANHPDKPTDPCNPNGEEDFAGGPTGLDNDGDILYDAADPDCSANTPPTADPNGPYSGTVDSPVSFDGSGSFDSDGSIVAYAWNFGDGSTGTGVNPTHSYATDGTFSVSLTVTDDGGATDMDSTTASIDPVPNEPPVADPNGPYSGTVGSPVSFDGSGSTDPDGTIVAYDWDFGDGNTGTGISPSHAYTADGTYTVSLTVTDDAGATDTATTTASIDPMPNEPPVADPNGPYSGTVGSPVSFDGSGSTDPDGSIVAYDWDFGDGNTGTGVSPSHAYTADGTYTVSLTVTDDAGATDTATTTASIDPVPNEPPVADPNGPYSGTVGSPVSFDGSGSTDPDGSIVAYDWDFGDGNTGTGVSPSHAYTADGTYTVSLTVTDDAGATDTATTTASIDPVPNEPPVADPNGPYSGTVGSPVSFDGSGSTDPDGSIVAYDWDFGDGNTGTGVSPSHAYTADGTYTVSLTVTDDAGATDTATTTASIDPVPNEPPVADPNGPYSGTVGSPVSFDGSGSTDPDGTIVAYDWDFGDGNTGTGVSPSHAYTADGTYTVSLTVTDDAGATDTATTTASIDPVPNEPPVADPNGPYSGTVGSPVSFDGSGSTDPDGTIVAYDWDFGDGNTGTGVSPSHAYTADGTYTVSLTVTDDAGATDTATTTASIDPVPNEPPVADPNGPYSGTVGSPVSFDGSGSTDPDGTIVAYDWDFGDGNTGTGISPSHAYTADGTYTVSLTVTDDAGATDTATTTASIDPVPNEPPVADPNGPYSGTVGSPVSFDGSGSTDPDGSIVAYDWDFGDGNTGTGVSPSHAYTADGTYTVSLTVTDDAGATDTATTTASIDPVPNEPPVADPNGPYSGTVGSPVSFDGSGSTDPDGSIVAYDWDFGDGNTGTGVSPSHAYTADGTYTVSLTVTDDAGATDTATTTASIDPVPNEPPVADPNGPYSGTVGSPVSFDGSGSTDPDGTIVAYDWDFGDGNTGTGVSPSHAYTADGTYTVSLTVTDDAGATDTATTTASIDPVPNEPPVADPNGPYSGTVGSPVSFDGSGSTDPDGTIVAYDWDFGDGNTGTGVSPSHAYTADGTYTVSLTVTDDAGATDTATTTASIDPIPNVPPTANAGGPYAGTVGSPVSFDGSGSVDTDGSIVAYDWDFGDGNTGTGVSPTHTYAGDGTFTVILTVTDDAGASDTDSTTATISVPDVLDLDLVSLKPTKRVSLTRVKPVVLKLVVKNYGTVEGSALATITGMQNGEEVYKATLTVTDPLGNGRTTYNDGSVPAILPYEPKFAGDILWTATIADDNPDVDEATAVTTVVP